MCRLQEIEQGQERQCPAVHRLDDASDRFQGEGYFTADHHLSGYGQIALDRKYTR